MSTEEVERPAIYEQVQQKSLFESPLARLWALQDALKEDRKMLRDFETDYPMELEDLILSLKDLQKQVADRKAEFIKNLLKNNADYSDCRVRIQQTKEEIAQKKTELNSVASKEVETRGENLNLKIRINDEEVLLQTANGTDVFINGKQI